MKFSPRLTLLLLVTANALLTSSLFASEKEITIEPEAALRISVVSEYDQGFRANIEAGGDTLSVYQGRDRTLLKFDPPFPKGKTICAEKL